MRGGAGPRACSAGGRPGHSQAGQRHVNAGRRHLLADDRQGADADSGGVAGRGGPYRQTLIRRRCGAAAETENARRVRLAFFLVSNFRRVGRSSRSRGDRWPPNDTRAAAP